MIDGWWEYFAVFAGAVLASRVLTPVALRQAMKFRILDHPGGHKNQGAAVPYLGGLAIVTSFTGAIVLAASLSEEVRVEGELRTILCLAMFLSLIGLLDDLRGIAPGWRLLSEVVAAAVVWHLGVGVLLTTIGFLDFMLTVVWIVGITNAFNLLDNMSQHFSWVPPQFAYADYR